MTAPQKGSTVATQDGVTRWWRSISLRAKVTGVTVMVLIYLGVNLLVDLLYAVLDPRVRHGR